MTLNNPQKTLTFLDYYNFDFSKTYPHIDFQNHSKTRQIWDNGNRATKQSMYFLNMQIEAMENVSKQVIAGNSKGHAAIKAGIQEQTTLYRKIQQLSTDQITKAISKNTEAINTIGQNICNVLEDVSSQLDEIGWTLQQSLSIQARQLEVMENRFKTEATELVKQGKILYTTGSFLEAKTIFTKAYDKDPTHFAVLMNLGFIAIYENKKNDAAEYFKFAYDRGTKGDAQLKATVLWALARLYRVAKKYINAHQMAKYAFGVIKEKKSIDYLKMAMYSCMAKQYEESKQQVFEAIKKRHDLAPYALAQNALFPIREDIIACVDVLARAYIQKKENQVKEWQKRLSLLNHPAIINNIRKVDAKIKSKFSHQNLSLVALKELQSYFPSHEAMVKKMEEQEQICKDVDQKKKEFQIVEQALSPWIIFKLIRAVITPFFAIASLFVPINEKEHPGLYASFALILDLLLQISVINHINDWMYPNAGHYSPLYKTGFIIALIVSCNILGMTAIFITQERKWMESKLAYQKVKDFKKNIGINS